MFRRTFAEIDLNIIYLNYIELRGLNRNKPIIPVIKADAYGHGGVRVFEFLHSKGIRKFAVATLEEALELTRSNVFKEAEIIVFCPMEVRDLNILLEYPNLIPIVSEVSFIGELEKFAVSRGKSISFGLEIDTGMGRLGIHYRDADKLVETIQGISVSKITDIMTHFPSSDFDREFSLYQLSVFDEILSSLKKIVPNVATHVSNSGGVLNIPEASKYDFARCGLSIYGYYPNMNLKDKAVIRNSITLKSYIALKKFFRKGESISYNRTYFLKEDGYIGVVPCGYADGIPTLFSNNMEVIINSRRYRVVGRITMDYFMVSIDSSVNVGDEVIVFGGSEEGSIRVEDFAYRVGLIPYEITCGISKRVPRIYKV
ncbi:MAG: alanine racemase [Spirochaetia bacterium]|nr:alanine racemase [Spirochaetota bacterium]MDW8113102.1 alanine racemase [Spirochaetia bacterium]